MQDQVVEMALSNGSTALARVTMIDGGGATKVGAIPRLDFDDVGRTLEGLAGTIRSSLAKAAPDKVTVGLSLELAVKNGKLSGLLVEGEGKGSIAVTLEWNGPPRGS
jgi:Trypsin-co-occurring domain 1